MPLCDCISPWRTRCKRISLVSGPREAFINLIITNYNQLRLISVVKTKSSFSVLDGFLQNSLDLVDIFFLPEKKWIKFDGPCLLGDFLNFSTSVLDAHFHVEHVKVSLPHTVDVAFSRRLFGLKTETLNTVDYLCARIAKFFSLGCALHFLLLKIKSNEFG